MKDWKFVVKSLAGNLMKSATLFYLGSIIIAASLAYGFMMYYYPVYTEIGREDHFIEVGVEDQEITVVSPLIKYRTTYPLRDYALLTYLFSGIGLVLIVIDYALKER